jgi:hypothetical protein
MFIPDTGSRVKKIPDPGFGSESTNSSIFKHKNCFSALGNMIRDVHPGSGLWFLPIPDPGSSGQKGTGSRIRIRNTVHGVGPAIKPLSLKTTRSIQKLKPRDNFHGVIWVIPRRLKPRHLMVFLKKHVVLQFSTRTKTNKIHQLVKHRVLRDITGNIAWF